MRDLELAKSRRSRLHENIRQANSDSDAEIGWYSLLSLKDIPDSLGGFYEEKSNRTGALGG